MVNEEHINQPVWGVDVYGWNCMDIAIRTGIMVEFKPSKPFEHEDNPGEFDYSSASVFVARNVRVSRTYDWSLPPERVYLSKEEAVGEACRLFQQERQRIERRENELFGIVESNHELLRL